MRPDEGQSEYEEVQKELSSKEEELEVMITSEIAWKFPNFVIAINLSVDFNEPSYYKSLNLHGMPLEISARLKILLSQWFYRCDTC